MFFKVIYYLIGLIVVGYQIYGINREFLRNVFYYSEANKKAKKRGEELNLDTLSSDFKKQVTVFGFMMLFQVSWLLIGLFSFNWQLILLYFGISTISGLIYRMNKNVNSFVTIGMFQRIVIILTILFATINSFHLHINLFQLIFGG